MKLYFKQRFFSWFDSYDIYHEDGSVAYTVEGKLSWGHCTYSEPPGGAHRHGAAAGADVPAQV